MPRLKPPHSESPDSLLDTGLHLHRSGRLDEAEAIYQQVLTLDPKNAEALHLLGVVKTRRGATREAVDLITAAIALKPSVVKFHLNLGVAQRAAGELDRAIESYRKAIELDPKLPEAHYNLGVALEAHGDLESAEKSFRQAMELRSDWVEAINNLGAVLSQQGKREEALPFSEKAVALKPTFAEAHVNLASVLNDLRRHDDAIAAADKALALNPNLVIAHLTRATALRMANRLDESIAGCERALKLNPNSPEAHVQLGNLFLELAQFDEATKSFDRALALKPDMPEAHLGKSLPLLLKGNLVEGFEKFNWWRKLRSAPLRKLDWSKVWRGEDIKGRTILLHGEGGRGDALNFIRYAALVKQRGARVIVLCLDSLAALIETAPGVDKVIREGHTLPEFDVHAPLFGLPAILGTTLETIPSKVPYLEPLPSVMFRMEVPPGTKLKVGLVWAGDAIHRNDHNRSVTAKDYAPLLELRNIAFYSLQVGPRAADVKDLKPAKVIDLSPRLTDYSATAAAIAQLDLVITVDTSVCHLSGAIARPTWTLLPFVPDWRWLWEREDSPWYPTMRLFRQPKRGDWDSVLKRVKTELTKLRDSK